jgi:hypothetical protein
LPVLEVEQPLPHLELLPELREIVFELQRISFQKRGFSHLQSALGIFFEFLAF